jgi:phospholipid/cholesterol/gamma-HCH transport system permease protein
MNTGAQPSIIHRRGSHGCVYVEIKGRWNLRTTRERAKELLADLERLAASTAHWDLTQLDDLDLAAATLLWNAWKRKRPADLALRPEDERLFRQLAALPMADTRRPRWTDLGSLLLKPGMAARAAAQEAFGTFLLLGEIVLSSAALLRKPATIPFREISAAIFRSGTQALAITALVGFLVGIVLSYLSAEQLRDLGADVFVVNLLGITILRELGPLIAAILNAGRSGSAMTAQIGVMRITHELEAMTVLGLSPAVRLVLPRVLGQMIALPLVVLWTDVLALAGGMLGARLQLGISWRTFAHQLPQVVPLTNLWFGVCKGILFGALVAVIACQFGLRARPDTEGLAASTTQSVVTGLTLVLLTDALLAIVFAHIGM